MAKGVGALRGRISFGGADSARSRYLSQNQVVETSSWFESGRGHHSVFWQFDAGFFKALARGLPGDILPVCGPSDKTYYIAVTKDFVGKKPRTRIALTGRGRKAFAQHIEFLRSIFDAAAPHHGDSE